MCQNVLNPGEPNEERMKGNETLTVPCGTTYLHVTPGAGGYGPPSERDAEQVARDVRDGKISPRRAREVYRAAISENGVVDAAATAKLRTI